MKKKLIDILTVITMTIVVIFFKYLNGFENTICLISSLVLIEVWKLNDKEK